MQKRIVSQRDLSFKSGKETIELEGFPPIHLTGNVEVRDGSKIDRSTQTDVYLQYGDLEARLSGFSLLSSIEFLYDNFLRVSPEVVIVACMSTTPFVALIGEREILRLDLRSQEYQHLYEFNGESPDTPRGMGMLDIYVFESDFAVRYDWAIIKVSDAGEVVWSHPLDAYEIVDHLDESWIYFRRSMHKDALPTWALNLVDGQKENCGTK